jgi:hypothetical protein
LALPDDGEIAANRAVIDVVKSISGILKLSGLCPESNSLEFRSSIYNSIVCSMQGKYIPSLVVLAVIHAYRLGRWQTWTIAKRLRTACVVSGVRLASALKRPVDGAACPPIFGETSNATKKNLAWTSICSLAKGLGITPDVLMALEGKDRQNQDRQELDTLLDLFTPSQLQLAIQVSKLIYAYKPGTSLPASQPPSPEL